MNRETRRRLFVDFFRATRNEISVDLYLYELAGITPESYGYFPRCSKWVSTLKGHPRTSYFLWVFFKFLWLAGGATIFFLLQFVPNWLCSTYKIRITSHEPIDGAVLALSSRVGDVINPLDFHGLPSTWITVPWAQLAQPPSFANPIEVFALLSRNDLCRCFYYAVCISYVAARRKWASNWVLQCYTAYRWFLVRMAIDKLSGLLIMAEHYDRWAVLVDGSMRASNARAVHAKAGGMRQLALVQHGSLGDLGASVGQLEGAIKLPSKLFAVSHLYTYGPDSEKAFKQYVLARRCVSRGLKVSYFNPTIELTSTLDCEGLKVLFVGHPLCESFHEHVFGALSSMFKFKGYYKPHPMNPMSSSMKQVGWEIVQDVGVFPKVDLLVSYPSTLVVEYEGLGIPAAVHSMSLVSKDVQSYLITVCKLIDSINTRRDCEKGYSCEAS